MKKKDYICQINFVNINRLTCSGFESGGQRCENLNTHKTGKDECFVGEHTIQHSLAGAGYVCENFE